MGVSTDEYCHFHSPSVSEENLTTQRILTSALGKGMDTWKGKQMHSHIYRVPEPFRNEYYSKYGDNCGFPPLEDWKIKICLSSIRDAKANLETYRDSWDDHELLQVAYQSPHFTQLSQYALDQ